MTTKPRALVIGTDVANSHHESGASIRLLNVKSLLVDSGFDVSVSSQHGSKDLLTARWDLIAVVSFSVARTLKHARRKTDFLWFDPTDSWNLTRLSLLRSGDIKQIFALIRDIFWLWQAPKIDLLTFITDRDLTFEGNWWKSRTNPLVLPVFDVERHLSHSKNVRLVFVGDGKYLPNKKSLKFLAQMLDSLPKNYNIHLYGKSLSVSHPRIINHGYVSCDEIYKTNDIHLAPIHYGAGMKLKVVIPLHNGIRVISTREGSVGIKPHPLLQVAETLPDFISAVRNALAEGNVARRPTFENIYLHDDTKTIVDILLTESKKATILRYD